jgi:hypothetical protein
MVVLERRPELNVRSGYDPELLVEPTGISFHDLPGDIVRIQVTVSNVGSERSLPTTMRLESAPLGAFVPWKPLAKLLVPALEPGESRDLSTDAKRPRPAPLGNFNRVPPKTLLTAVNSPDQPSPQPVAVTALLNFLRRGQGDAPTSTAKPSLAPDLWDLVGQGQTYWAGNINVFVGNRAVERHLAKALRIYPGRTNIAMFVTGSPGRRDAFSFELVGLSPDWKAALYDVTNRRTLVVDPLAPLDDCIEESHWVESNEGLLVVLATQPPADCAAGNLEVHVTCRESRKTAVVEFNLDPAAQGSGCYCL